MMEVKQMEFYDVNDVMGMLGIKQTKAYEIIKTLNKELQDQGKITIAGKVSKKYFLERVL